MIKLNITLGNTFFSHFYLPYSSEYGKVLPKVSQHRVVLSRYLIDYYEECAAHLGLRDACTTYIQELVQSSLRCQIIQGCSQANIEEELIETARLQPMKLLLADKSEIKKARKGINLLRCEDINDNANCTLNLYCIPVTTRYIEAKKSVEAYVKWIGNWLAGERELTFRDKYLLTDRGIESFKKYYLPIIEKGAKISIQTDEDVDQKYIDEFDNSIYDDYLINIYKCEKMHERVIVLKEIQIVIGKGIDFLSANWELTDETFISISNITIDVKKSELCQLR